MLLATAPRVYEKTLEMFGDRKAAFTWLTTPARALGLNTPLDLLIEDRIDEVMDLLGRIDHGIVS